VLYALSKKGRKGWLIIGAILTTYVALQFFFFNLAMRGPSPFSDAFMTLAVRAGASILTAANILFLIAITAGVLYLLHTKFDIFSLPSTHNFYWLRVVFFVFAFFEIEWVAMIFVNYRVFSEQVSRHLLYYQVAFRVNCVTILLIAAVGLYLFKQKSKIFYGTSEIIVAIFYNLALIRHIDLSHIPKISVPTADIVGLAVFTYLLSRGFSNLAEGIDERSKEKAKPATPAAAPPAVQ
jgi:hypothetical protein